MKWLSAIYSGFCKVEEAIVSVFITLITGLLFVGAVSRYLGTPLNWTQELALLLMAWVVFLGADVALRTIGFIRVDLLVLKFPLAVQKVLNYTFQLASIAFLLLIVYFGTQLMIEHWPRLYQTIGISYSWATASAPVGSILLIITIIKKLYENRGQDEVVSEGQEAI